jgi:hypothetical protein
MNFNDWMCPDCGHSNFGRRDKCERCACFRSKARKFQQSMANRTLDNFSRKPTGYTMDKKPTFKPGDWFCESCTMMNFGSRVACYKCGKERQVPAPPTKTDSSLNSTTEDKKCAVCLERDLEAVFKKCGHLVCCMVCATAMTRCPMCREPVNPDDGDILKVYTA